MLYAALMQHAFDGLLAYVSLMLFGLIMLALGKHFITDNHRQAYSSGPVVLFILFLAGGAAGVTSLRAFDVNILDFFSVRNSQNHKHSHDSSSQGLDHNNPGSGGGISPETWKHIGIVLGAVVVAVVLFVAIIYGAKRFKKWYLSPEKVEARALRDSEAIQRIHQGLTDNADYQTLSKLCKDLSRLKSPEAQGLLTQITAKREEIRRQEEHAALAYAHEELERIKFMNDPAKSDEARRMAS
jgi:hypothetical protein